MSSSQQHLYFTNFKFGNKKDLHFKIEKLVEALQSFRTGELVVLNDSWGAPAGSRFLGPLPTYLNPEVVADDINEHNGDRVFKQWMMSRNAGRVNDPEICKTVTLFWGAVDPLFKP